MLYVCTFKKPLKFLTKYKVQNTWKIYAYKESHEFA